MKEKYKCWYCGNEIELAYEPRERICCEDCFVKAKEEHKALVAEYSKLKIKVMYENALRMMEKSGRCYMHEYYESAERILQKALSDTESFMSSHEMVVAIVLDNLMYLYEPNYKILNYRVDFFIPELKACLEVDGNLHEHKLEYDSRRDIAIRDVLGPEWEVIRIRTKYIEENPEKVVDAIEAMITEKKKLRKKNRGYMPYGFSKRDNTLYTTKY